VKAFLIKNNDFTGSPDASGQFPLLVKTSLHRNVKAFLIKNNDFTGSPDASGQFPLLVKTSLHRNVKAFLIKKRISLVLPTLRDSSRY
jgi:hypothetical protein